MNLRKDHYRSAWKVSSQQRSSGSDGAPIPFCLLLSPDAEGCGGLWIKGVAALGSPGSLRGWGVFGVGFGPGGRPGWLAGCGSSEPSSRLPSYLPPAAVPSPFTPLPPTGPRFRRRVPPEHPPPRRQKTLSRRPPGPGWGLLTLVPPPYGGGSFRNLNPHTARGVRSPRRLPGTQLFSLRRREEGGLMSPTPPGLAPRAARWDGAPGSLSCLPRETSTPNFV